MKKIMFFIFFLLFVFMASVVDGKDTSKPEKCTFPQGKVFLTMSPYIPGKVVKIISYEDQDIIIL